PGTVVACNGTVSTLWHTRRRGGGAVAGREAGPQNGTTRTAIQRETAASVWPYNKLTQDGHAFPPTGRDPNHRTVCEGRDDPQHPPLTPGAARPSKHKHPLQQSCPAPARRPGVRLPILHPLLAWG